MSVNQRINIVVREKEKTQRVWAEKMGISPQYANQLTKKDYNIGMDVIRKILDLYPDINPTWLIIGEGDMYKEKQYVIPSPDHNLSDGPGIPVFEVQAAAGRVELYNDMNQQKPVGFVQIPGFEDCDFALPVWGDSMYPALKNGSYIIGKWITDVNSIAWGETYYVEWEDYRMVKVMVRGSSDEEILLCSINNTEVSKGRLKYAPIRVKMDHIRKIAIIKGCFAKYNH